ncbi:MAG: YceI family protein [Candidatus Thiodiazotropha sp.]
MIETPIKTALVLFLVFSLPQSVSASDYAADTEGGHAYIQFKISHLGLSRLAGRYSRFSGDFSYDENNPSAATIEVVIDTRSIDSNHAECDWHVRDEDFLNVAASPEARFFSRSFNGHGEGKAALVGDLTLRGVTRPVRIEVDHVGEGTDPWGGYRHGFSGKTRIVLADYALVRAADPDRMGEAHSALS